MTFPSPATPQSAKLDTELRSARTQLAAATSQAQDASRKWQAAESQLRQAESKKEELVKTAQVGSHTRELHSSGGLVNQLPVSNLCAVTVLMMCCIKCSMPAVLALPLSPTHCNPRHPSPAGCHLQVLGPEAGAQRQQAAGSQVRGGGQAGACGHCGDRSGRAGRCRFAVSAPANLCHSTCPTAACSLTPRVVHGNGTVSLSC